MTAHAVLFTSKLLEFKFPCCAGLALISNSWKHWSARWITILLYWLCSGEAADPWNKKSRSRKDTSVLRYAI